MSPLLQALMRAVWVDFIPVDILLIYCIRALVWLRTADFWRLWYQSGMECWTLPALSTLPTDDNRFIWHGRIKRYCDCYPKTAKCQSSPFHDRHKRNNSFLRSRCTPSAADLWCRCPSLCTNDALSQYRFSHARKLCSLVKCTCCRWGKSLCVCVWCD